MLTEGKYGQTSLLKNTMAEQRLMALQHGFTENAFFVS